MELIICDKDFNRIGQVVNASSKIWHRKFRDVGDFEIYLPATSENLNILVVDNYIIRDDSDEIGIIENREIVYDINDEVDMVVISGRFSESIYERRIVWQQTQLNTTVELGLRSLITSNMILPTEEDRKIDEIGLGAYKGYSEKMEAQYFGEEILTIIKDECALNLYGFKNVFSNNKFNFEVYKGVDRSYAQTENPFVVFSDRYDNLLSSKYVQNKTNYKNTALVAGEGEGVERKTQTVGAENKGLNRRELFVDSRTISSNNGEITEEVYNSQLKASGEDKLSQKTLSEVFTGDIELTDRYRYKIDVDLGDICTIENQEWGISSNSQIIGIIETDDKNGESIVFEFGS